MPTMVTARGRLMHGHFRVSTERRAHFGVSWGETSLLSLPIGFTTLTDGLTSFHDSLNRKGIDTKLIMKMRRRHRMNWHLTEAPTERRSHSMYSCIATSPLTAFSQSSGLDRYKYRNHNHTSSHRFVTWFGLRSQLKFWFIDTNRQIWRNSLHENLLNETKTL